MWQSDHNRDPGQAFSAVEYALFLPFLALLYFSRCKNLWGKKEFFKIYFSIFNFKVLRSGIVKLATWYSEIELLALPLLIRKREEVTDVCQPTPT